MRRKIAMLVLMTAYGASCLLAREPRVDWLSRVPGSDRARTDPLGGDEAAAKAGAVLFDQHCASCHGEDARGIGKRPSLRTARVHQATDGELQWLLRNGSLRNGMPAWANLPEVQRWQLVRYLHTLPAEDER